MGTCAGSTRREVAVSSNDQDDTTVRSLEALEALYGTPASTSLDKELTQLNDDYRQLIEASPFVTIATAGPNGFDCSPRGDKGAVVHVLDDNTLALPDRRGNKRLDTLRNLISDPRIGLLFLIPGVNETLRVNGRAQISVDESLRERYTVGDRTPTTVLIVHIEQVYFQCARAITRSALWDINTQIDRKSLPSTGSLIASAIASGDSATTDFDTDEYNDALYERQKSTLW